MRILGIDPGTAITGFGMIDYCGGRLTAVDSGVITTPAHQELSRRLATIYDELMQLINSSRPDVMAVEQIYFAANVTTAISVAHARGVAVLTAGTCGLSVAEYTPLEIKQAITGYGRAEKKQMQAMVKSQLGLAAVPRPDDAADALAVAICHTAFANQLGSKKA